MKRRVMILTTTAAALAWPSAAVACPEVETAPSFANFGDESYYTPVPGGTFEGGVLTWTSVGDVTLVDQNNPFAVSGEGISSVLLGENAVITSPELCINRNYPHMRFVAVADKNPELRVEVLWTDDKGKPKVTDLGAERGDRYRSWNPSRIIKLTKVLPRDEAVRDVHVQLSSRGKGSWLVDDVLVDPVKRG